MKVKRWRLLTALAVIAATVVITAPASAAGSRVSVGRWFLESFPGVSRSVALADVSAWDKDSPLSATNLAWRADAHMIGGEAASFNGKSSVAATDGPVVDTTGSFSVAAWVRPATLTGNRDFLGQDFASVADAGRRGGFSVGIRHQGGAAHWAFRMGDGSKLGTDVVAAIDPHALPGDAAGHWTHVAASYDGAARRMTLYVNGVAVAQADRPATPWASTGAFTVGRSDDGGPDHFWNGEVTWVSAYDRALTDADLFGSGFLEGGLLDAVNVGSWNFSAAVPCYLPEVPDTCNAPEGATFGRTLQLSFGTDVISEDRVALGFDDSTYVFDADGNMVFNEDGTPALQPSTEYAYLDNSVIHTSDSFSASVVVRLNDTVRRQTIVSLGAAGAQPTFAFAYADGAYTATLAQSGGAATISVPVADPEAWHQLLVVYDRADSTFQLYLDGVPSASATVDGTAEAGGRLEVARSTAGDGYLFGAVDDLLLWQGALTERQVAQLADWRTHD